ncbi:MAG: MBL fold metallo-hydrolase [Lachnospiraceae bacterium]|jgi:L-ascorbate metabolism protein UlaG (beta-lactamase superfamily)|nr:MBL fold metallo-hydrolase [Lachnospiraceae bacterium]
MKVTYLHHSGFLVELADRYLLFDWFEGQLPAFDGGKTLYVFASHVHGDHFSQKIFGLAPRQAAPHAAPQPSPPSGVFFILSDDIPPRRVPPECKELTTFVKPRQTLEINGMTVKTYRSTDEGVAFLIAVSHQLIFHAGDLNHWYWEGEPEDWLRRMTTDYHHELGLIAQDVMSFHRSISEKDRPLDIPPVPSGGTDAGFPPQVSPAGRATAPVPNGGADAAFLPLDPRLEDNFYLGIDDFMRTVGAKTVFPMHMWDDLAIIDRLKALPAAAPYKDRIVPIHARGETFMTGSVMTGSVMT